MKKMKKFDKLYNKIVFEEVGKLPTTDTILPESLCNPDNCYRWVKGQANVYACMITEDNVELATKFLQNCRENKNKQAQVGKYLVFNPNIPEEGGQVWMNKLSGYSKATSENSAFDSLHISEGGLEFDEYVFIPKTENLEEGLDTWVGFQIPNGMEFKVEEGCGNNGADDSSSFGTDWLPIVNGRFDWSRSLVSMKQSNFKCTGKEQPKIDEECLNSWKEQTSKVDKNEEV